MVAERLFGALPHNYVPDTAEDWHREREERLRKQEEQRLESCTQSKADESVRSEDAL